MRDNDVIEIGARLLSLLKVAHAAAWLHRVVSEVVPTERRAPRLTEALDRLRGTLEELRPGFTNDAARALEPREERTP